MTEPKDSDRPAHGKSELPELVVLRDIVDLGREPENEARAIWYEQQIKHGRLQAYGHRHEAGVSLVLEPDTTPVPIPPQAWRTQIIQWSTGDAVRAIARASNPPPTWRGLQIPRHESNATAPPSGFTLPLTFPDARRLVHRWRELSEIPPEWVWPEERFWKLHRDKRPDPRETDSAVTGALLAGEIKVVVPVIDHPDVPWSIFEAVNLKERSAVELKTGRIRGNLSDAARALEDLHLATSGVTEGNLGHPERCWLVMAVPLAGLHAWFRRAWPAADERPEVEAAKPLGRKAEWPWSRIVAEVALKLAREGKLWDGEVLNKELQQVAKKLHGEGREPGRSTVQEHARAIIEAWNSGAGNAGKSPGISGPSGKDKPEKP